MIAVGRPREGNDTIYKMMISVLFAPKNLSQSHTCCSIVHLQDRSGTLSCRGFGGIRLPHLATWWTSSRKKLTKVDRKAFDTLVILTSWMIWNERNRRTFDSRVKTVHELWACILDEAVAWDIAGFKLISSFVVASGRRSLAL